MDSSTMRAECQGLTRRIEGRAHWDDLRAAYLDLVPLLGHIQAAVKDAARTHEGQDEARQAQRSFESLRAGVRQLGFDIRLSSEGTLQIGLESALSSALETLDWLDRLAAER